MDVKTEILPWRKESEKVLKQSEIRTEFLLGESLGPGFAAGYGDFEESKFEESKLEEIEFEEIEIKQSGIETIVYGESWPTDEFFSPETASPAEAAVEEEKTRNNRKGLAIVLAALGGLFLFGGAILTVYFLPARVFEPAAVHKFEADQLPGEGRENNLTEEGAGRQTTLEPEKNNKPDFSNEKNILTDNNPKKEISVQPETKPSNAVSQTDKNPAPRLTPAELPKLPANNSREVQAKKPDLTVFDKNRPNNEARQNQIVTFPQKNSSKTETVNLQTTRYQTRREDTTAKNNSGNFRRETERNRQTLNKNQQINAVRREKIRNVLQTRRRKN